MRFFTVFLSTSPPLIGFFFVALCLDFWNPSNWILFVLSPCYCSFDLIPFSLFSSSAYMDEWKWSEVGCHFFVEGFFLFFFFSVCYEEENERGEVRES